MTPQEKVKELFDKYVDYVRMHNDDTPRLDMQKQCALIAVNEICRAVEFLDDETEDFWLDVKIEIEKL